MYFLSFLAVSKEVPSSFIQQGSQPEGQGGDFEISYVNDANHFWIWNFLASIDERFELKKKTRREKKLISQLITLREENSEKIIS